jgi:hypothetical protein
MKPYSWEEIEKILKEELNKTKHILTWGTIGSLNVEKDIDTIITKKPSSKLSDFYKEVHHIFDSINEYLKKKYKTNAIRFSFSGEEMLVRHIGDKGQGLAFHTMIYTNMPQLEEDWKWSMFKDERVDTLIKEDYICIKGSKEELFSKQFMKTDYYNSVLILLYLYDKINSQLPDKLLMEIMNHYYDYLYRKRLGLKAPQAKNTKEVRKYFYDLCDIIDKLRAEKSGYQ